MELGTIIYVIYLLAAAYVCFIVARVLLSWLRPRPGHAVYGFYRALFWLTEPYLGLFRRLLPMRRIGRVRLDLSPAVGLVILVILLEILGGFS
jgi:YggT family protein